MAVSRLGSIRKWNGRLTTGAMITQTYALTRIGRASKVMVITPLRAIGYAAATPPTKAAIRAFARALIQAA
jgi:hypothetical protein